MHTSESNGSPVPRPFVGETAWQLTQQNPTFWIRTGTNLIQICTQKRNATFWQRVWYWTVNRICISSAALYQICKNSPKTCYSYRSDTDMCILIWYCPDATAVLIQFRKYARIRTFWQWTVSDQKIFCCVPGFKLYTDMTSGNYSSTVPVHVIVDRSHVTVRNVKRVVVAT